MRARRVHQVVVGLVLVVQMLDDLRVAVDDAAAPARQRGQAAGELLQIGLLRVRVRARARVRARVRVRVRVMVGLGSTLTLTLTLILTLTLTLTLTGLVSSVKSTSFCCVLTFQFVLGQRMYCSTACTCEQNQYAA